MNVTKIVSAESQCVAAACPAVYDCDDNEDVIVVGKKVDPKTAGLTEKVADNEAAVIIKEEILAEAVKIF